MSCKTGYGKRVNPILPFLCCDGSAIAPEKDAAAQHTTGQEEHPHGRDSAGRILVALAALTDPESSASLPAAT